MDIDVVNNKLVQLKLFNIINSSNYHNILNDEIYKIIQDVFVSSTPSISFYTAQVFNKMLLRTYERDGYICFYAKEHQDTKQFHFLIFKVKLVDNVYILDTNYLTIWGLQNYLFDDNFVVDNEPNIIIYSHTKPDITYSLREFKNHKLY